MSWQATNQQNQVPGAGNWYNKQGPQGNRFENSGFVFPQQGNVDNCGQNEQPGQVNSPQVWNQYQQGYDYNNWNMYANSNSAMATSNSGKNARMLADGNTVGASNSTPSGKANVSKQIPNQLFNSFQLANAIIPPPPPPEEPPKTSKPPLPKSSPEPGELRDDEKHRKEKKKERKEKERKERKSERRDKERDRDSRREDRDRSKRDRKSDKEKSRSKSSRDDSDAPNYGYGPNYNYIAQMYGTEGGDPGIVSRRSSSEESSSRKRDRDKRDKKDRKSDRKERESRKDEKSKKDRNREGRSDSSRDSRDGSKSADFGSPANQNLGSNYQSMYGQHVSIGMQGGAPGATNMITSSQQAKQGQNTPKQGGHFSPSLNAGTLHQPNFNSQNMNQQLNFQGQTASPLNFPQLPNLPKQSNFLQGQNLPKESFSHGSGDSQHNFRQGTPTSQQSGFPQRANTPQQSGFNQGANMQQQSGFPHGQFIQQQSGFPQGPNTSQQAGFSQGNNSQQQSAFQGPNTSQQSAFPQGQNNLQQSGFAQGQNTTQQSGFPQRANTPQQSNLVQGMNNQQSGLPQGMNVQQSGLPQGMNVRQSGLPKGMNIQQSGLPQGVNIQQSGLTQGINNQQSGLPQGMIQQSGLPQGMNQQSGLPQGMNNQQSGLPQGMNNQQSGLPQGMNNQQSGLPQGMNNQQSGLPQGMNNQQSGLPQGMNQQSCVPQVVNKNSSFPQGVNNQTSGFGPNMNNALQINFPMDPNLSKQDGQGSNESFIQGKGSSAQQQSKPPQMVNSPKQNNFPNRANTPQQSGFSQGANIPLESTSPHESTTPTSIKFNQATPLSGVFSRNSNTPQQSNSTPGLLGSTDDSNSTPSNFQNNCSKLNLLGYSTSKNSSSSGLIQGMNTPKSVQKGSLLPTPGTNSGLLPTPTGLGKLSRTEKDVSPSMSVMNDMKKGEFPNTGVNSQGGGNNQSMISEVSLFKSNRAFNNKKSGKEDLNEGLLSRFSPRPQSDVKSEEDDQKYKEKEKRKGESPTAHSSTAIKFGFNSNEKKLLDGNKLNKLETSTKSSKIEDDDSQDKNSKNIADISVNSLTSGTVPPTSYMLNHPPPGFPFALPNFSLPPPNMKVPTGVKIESSKALPNPWEMSNNIQQGSWKDSGNSRWSKPNEEPKKASSWKDRLKTPDGQSLMDKDWNDDRREGRNLNDRDKSSNWRDRSRDWKDSRSNDGGRSLDWKDSRGGRRNWEDRKRKDSTKWEENMDIEDDKKGDDKEWGGNSWSSHSSSANKTHMGAKASPGKYPTASSLPAKDRKKEQDPMSGEWPDSLKKYVGRCFKECVTEKDKDQVESSLKAKLTEAAREKVMWEKDWDNEPIIKVHTHDMLSMLRNQTSTYTPAPPKENAIKPDRKQALEGDPSRGFTITRRNQDSRSRSRSPFGVDYRGKNRRDRRNQDDSGEFSKGYLSLNAKGGSHGIFKRDGSATREDSNRGFGRGQRGAGRGAQRGVSQRLGTNQYNQRGNQRGRGGKRGRGGRNFTDWDAPTEVIDVEEATENKDSAFYSTSGASMKLDADLCTEAKLNTRAARFTTPAAKPAKKVPQTINFGGSKAPPAKKKKASTTQLDISLQLNTKFSVDADNMDWENMHVEGTSTEVAKKFFRLTTAPDPSTIRTIPTLHKALDLVKKDWITKQDYRYACDQIKSIRQDLTVQGIRDDFTVQVYETHARIALEKGDHEEFNQCQTQLKELYVSCNSKNSLEFMAYRLIYYMFTKSTLDITSLLACLTKADKLDPCVSFALKLRASWSLSNYKKFFMLYKKAPKMTGHLVDWFKERERKAYIKIIVKSYRPGNLETAFVKSSLGFKTGEEWNCFADSVGITYTDRTNTLIDCKNSAAGVLAA